LAEGLAADITAFDPERVIERATFEARTSSP
jgi:N-acyl-D-aspartate/D-glutamate deacylase